MTVPQTAFVSRNLAVATAVAAPGMLDPRTFDGIDIAMGSFASGFPHSTEGTPPFTPGEYDQPAVAVAGGFMRALDPRAKEKEFDLDVFVKGGMGPLLPRRLRFLDATFAPSKGERWLTASDGIRDWRIAVRVVGAAYDQSGDLSWRRYRLRAADPRWQAVGATTDYARATGASLAWTLDGGAGNARAPLAVAVTPRAAKAATADYTQRSQVILANRCPRALRNYPVTLNMNTAAEVAAGRLQAGGDDLRVFVDGAEVPRWLGSMNAADSRVWIALDLAPARTATLAATITSGSPAAGGTLDLVGGDTLPEGGVLLVDSEAIAWTGKTRIRGGWRLSGISRGVRATAAASHVAAATAYYVEHQVDVLWGWSAAPTPSYDPLTKPCFSLLAADSANTRWKYTTEWTDAEAERPGAWQSDYQLTNDKLFAARGVLGSPTALPTADGTYTSGSPVNTATRWDAVNDPVGTPDDNGTYVSRTATGKTSFAVTPPVVPAGTIIGNVEVHVRWESLSASTGADVYGMLRAGGVDAVEVFLGSGNIGAYGAAVATWPFSPVTGRAWKAEDVAAIQEIGFDVTGMNAATEVRVTQVYLLVTYAPQADPAAALGLYVNPDAPVAGYAAGDTWTVQTPAGALGAASIAITLLAGPTGAVSDSVEVLGTDLDGVTKPVGKNLGSVANATEVVTLTPLGAMVAVGVRLDTSSTALFDGVGITAATLQFDTTRVPALVQGAREAVYPHRWTLANADTGQQVEVSWPGAIGGTLTVDADAKTVTYSLPGYNVVPALVAATDRAWLEAEPYDNALTWTDEAAAAASDVLVATTYRERLL